MGTIYNYAKQQGYIKAYPGGSVDWSQALIDSGKTVSQITLMALTVDEVNALISKLDMLFPGIQQQTIANMIAEELPNIIATVQATKWQTQSAFGGILAQGTQLDIWPLRPKDVGGVLLNPLLTPALGLYGGVSAGVFDWLVAGLVGGVAANIIPTQTMWQYAGMIYLGGIEKITIPKMAGIQFTLAGIAAPPQPLMRNTKKLFGIGREISFSRLEKPVIIPPLKNQAVSLMPDTAGSSDFEFIALVVAQSQNKAL